MDPRKRFLVIALLFLFLIPVAGCPNNDDNNNSLTPSTTGVAVSSVKSFTEVTGFVVGMIDQLNEALGGAAPPIAKQPRAATPVPCENYTGTDGYMDVEQTGLAEYTLTGHNCVADDGSLVINTTAVVAPFDTATCSPDMGTTVFPAPAEFSVVVNGAVSVNGVDFTLTALNIYFLNVVYDPLDGCGIDTFGGTLAGTVSNGATVDFSAFGFTVPFISDTEFWLDVDGTFTVNTPCESDETYTLATAEPSGTMHIPIDGSCATEGILDITKFSDGSSVEIDFASDPNACDNAACQAG